MLTCYDFVWACLCLKVGSCTRVWCGLMNSQSPRTICVHSVSLNVKESTFQLLLANHNERTMCRWLVGWPSISASRFSSPRRSSQLWRVVSHSSGEVGCVPTAILRPHSPTIARGSTQNLSSTTAANGHTHAVTNGFGLPRSSGRRGNCFAVILLHQETLTLVWILYPKTN